MAWRAPVHPPPYVGPQGHHFTGHRSLGKESGNLTTWAPWLGSIRHPSLRCLPLLMCFQSLASPQLTPLRWAPGLEGCGLAPRLRGLGWAGAEACRHQPFAAWALGVQKWGLRAQGSECVEAEQACVLAQVQSPSLPPGPALPSGIPPYAPISQPAVQFLLQGSQPLPGCGAAQSLAPVSTIPTAASEPAGHAAAATATNDSEERTAPPRPAPEKAKNEEVRPCPSPRGRRGPVARC